MPASRRFVVDLKLDDGRVAEGFRDFIAGIGLRDSAALDATAAFETSVAPHLGGMRTIAARGGNVDFSKVLETDAGPVVVTLNTAKPGLVERLLRLFRG